MKKFIKNFLIFILAILIPIISVIIFSNYFVSKKIPLSLDSNIKYLVLGNSHPVYSINDTKIKNLKNFAKSGECHFYSYQKLKQLLKYNLNIDTVFIEISAMYIKKQDNLIWNDNSLIGNYNNWAPFMSYNDQKLIMKKNLKGYLKNVPSLINLNIKKLISRNPNYLNNISIGGYKEASRSLKTDSIIKLVNNFEESDFNEYDLPLINLEYLDKIIKLCHNQNIKLIFIRCPIHRDYKGRKLETSFNQLINDKYKGIPFWDFANYNLPDSCFRDYHHLNSNGAKRFTDFFNKKLINRFYEK